MYSEKEKYTTLNSLYHFITGMPVPIAIIVCEGDIDTIAHTAGALQNKLPVVIIKGSGKAADLILNYLERYTVLVQLIFLSINMYQ